MSFKIEGKSEFKLTPLLFILLFSSASIGAQEIGDVYYPQPVVCPHKPSPPNVKPIKKLVSDSRSMVTCNNVSNFTATYDSDMPTAAQTAFNYALGLMEDLFDASVTITVDVTWEDIPGNAIGFAGASAWRANLSFLPLSNVWYPEPLINQYNGSQYNSGSDINMTLDSSTNWYFGTAGNPSNSQIDLVSVVLHELSHGMGFAGSAASDGTAGGSSIGWGSNDWPNIYDLQIENGSGTPITNYNSGTTALLNQLIGDNLHFDGFYCNGAHHGEPAQIKADSPWTPGSSFSHLDASFNDEIMRSFIVAGDAIHTLDTLAISIFRDMGWDVCADNCPTEYTVANANELDGTQAHDASFQSDGEIESEQVINNGRTVEYLSDNCVELLQGFHSNTNVTFEARIGPCGDY